MLPVGNTTDKEGKGRKLYCDTATLIIYVLSVAVFTQRSRRVVETDYRW